jgi:hypothetical protein
MHVSGVWKKFHANSGSFQILIIILNIVAVFFIYFRTQNQLLDESELQLLRRLSTLPWMLPNPSHLPYCTLSDRDSQVFPASLNSRYEWPIGNSVSKGKCIPFINIDVDQISRFYLDVCVASYQQDVESWSLATSPVHVDPVMWQVGEAAVQYCLIRELKPRLVIEIGSGTSTRFAAHAMKLNAKHGFPGHLESIDPEPRTGDDNKAVKSDPTSGFSFSFLKKSVTSVSLSHFDALNSGDILFIDSSHFFSFDSDVRFEFTDILLRLKKGVIIHVRFVSSFACSILNYFEIIMIYRCMIYGNPVVTADTNLGTSKNW